MHNSCSCCLKQCYKQKVEYQTLRESTVIRTSWQRDNTEKNTWEQSRECIGWNENISTLLMTICLSFCRLETKFSFFFKIKSFVWSCFFSFLFFFFFIIFLINFLGCGWGSGSGGQGNDRKHEKESVCFSWNRKRYRLHDNKDT